MVLCRCVSTEPRFFNKRQRKQIQLSATRIQGKYKITKKNQKLMEFVFVVIVLCSLCRSLILQTKSFSEGEISFQ